MSTYLGSTKKAVIIFSFMQYTLKGANVAGFPIPLTHALLSLIVEHHFSPPHSQLKLLLLPKASQVEPLLAL